MVLLSSPFREQCVNVSFQECSEEINPVSCDDKEIGRIPYQANIHVHMNSKYLILIAVYPI